MYLSGHFSYKSSGTWRYHHDARLQEYSVLIKSGLDIWFRVHPMLARGEENIKYETLL